MATHMPDSGRHLALCTILVVANVAMAATGFTSAVQASHTNARATCAPATARVVARSNEVQVYRGSDDAYVACNARTKRRLRFDSELGLSVIRAAGRYVGFEESFSSSSGSSSTIRVLDTRSRRYRHAIAQRIDVRSATPISPGDVAESATDLAVSTSGLVTWIASVRTYFPCPEDSTRGCGPQTGYEVRQALGRTRFRVLDSGATIGPRSLTASKGRVVWTKAGRRVSRRSR
jgi:hypothetical protein